MDAPTIVVQPGNEPDSVDYSSSEEGDVSEDSGSDEEEIRPTTHALGLNVNYVRSWHRVDAFREFYQNWKDAIVDRFGIDPRDPDSFKPKWRETKTQIQITIHRPVPGASGRPSQELLGYIRFDTKRGILELANFNAALEMRHLSLGGTTKRGHDQFAGTHGEGFKLAALVMRRAGHNVRISASSFYWAFNFRGYSQDRFYCRLTPVKPEKVQKQKEAFVKKTERAPRGGALTSYAWQDVTVKIWNKNGSFGSRITEQQFRSWVAVSLDLSGPPPEGIIWTRHGDLILDKKYSGRLYLKGLRVTADYSPSETKYVFGYNFAQGDINRDRERLTSSLSEAATLARIWEEPILGGREDILRHYIDLFHQHEDSPDIALAEKVVSEAVARAVWDAMRRRSPVAFFYLEEDGADQRTIIVDNLRKQPESVPRGLWKILRKFALVRTPHEERLSRFLSSQPADVNENAFSSNISRMLMAGLQLDERMKTFKLQVVKGGATGINLIFKEDDKSLLIHEKWFDMDKTHEETGCDLFTLAQQNALSMAGFSCDHVVEDLFDLILDEVRRHIEGVPSEIARIRQTARQLIRQTPRGVRVCQTPNVGELEVTWIGNESEIIVRHYAADILYNVVLHKASSCGQKRLELLQHVDDSGSPAILCGCQHQVVSRASSTATFRALDTAEEYFPMVARAGHDTFFGAPPAPIMPRMRDSIRLVGSSPRAQGHWRQTIEPRVHESTPRLSCDDADLLHEDSGNESSDYNDNESNDGTYSDGDFDDGDSGPRNEADNDLLTSDIIATRSSTDVHRDPAAPAIAREVRPGPALLDTFASLPSQEDERAWQVWHIEELPRISSRVFDLPTRKCLCESNNGFLDSTLVCQRLDFMFETDTYVRIREHSETHPEYIALIHAVHEGGSRCFKSSHLAATRYSFLQPETLIPNLNTRMSGREVGNTFGEVILHFSSPESMGTQADSEAINIEDIIEVQALPRNFEIRHCVEQPPESSEKAFCRFARSASRDGVVVMPLAPHLLDRRDRQKLDGFSEPSMLSVVDLSPNILGPLEGFIDTGCTAFAGIGFDEKHNGTWRVRYPHCPVFDSPPQDVFNDLASGNLATLGLPASNHPKIGLVSGGNSNFRLSQGNWKEPPVELFLSPLDILDSTTKSCVNPNFTVLHMPAAILHPLTASRLSESIFKLLEQKQSVRIGLLSLQDYGIPQNRTTLVVVASPFPGLAKVAFRRQPFTNKDRSGHNNSGPISKIKDFIGDLAFENPRTSAGSQRRFVCSSSPGEVGLTGLPAKNIYNHQTGRAPAVGDTTVVDMESEYVDLRSNSNHPLTHPDRQDQLTIRELARLQGFKDDFVFYGPIELQYKEVLAGHPPIIAKVVAETIRNIVSISRRVQLRDGSENDRTSKRPRVEEAVN